MMVLFLAHGTVISTYDNNENSLCFRHLEPYGFGRRQDIGNSLRRAYGDLPYLHSKRGEAPVPYAEDPIH